MNILLVFSTLCFFVALVPFPSVSSERASTPPRGWNSYDSFCWTVSEEEFLESADIVLKRLKPHGYEYVVVDYLWYRKKVPGANTTSPGFDLIDEWGRMVPDPERWPSSRGGKGFTEVANKVHSMGLKFGIHVMSGLSTQAFNANTLILDTTKGGPYEESGRQWRAQDIGLKEKPCAWMPQGFMALNGKLGAAKAFLRSLYQQFAEWGVDFVKHDCVFGNDLDIEEISFVSELLSKLDRTIVYSLSPGTSVTPAMAKDVSSLTNMYRITGDDWDSWPDIFAHFNVSRDFAAANMIGSQGLLGKSWPDLDMLPLGWLTEPDSNEGPHRWSNLSPEEQRTQMILWAMAKSPLMFGGDVRKLDDDLHKLITNPTLMEINSFSSNNMEFPLVSGSKASGVQSENLTQEQKEAGMSGDHALGLISCNDPKANGWSLEATQPDERVCWKQSLGTDDPFCLLKRKPLLVSDEEIISHHKYQGRTNLLATDDSGLCLSAGSKRRLTSKESTRASFSSCKFDANQIWEVNNTTGKLQNSYNGLCATLYNMKGNNITSRGVRAWVATGRGGEIYVAFFNLNPEESVISAQISDLDRALPGKNLKPGSCKQEELWRGRDLGVAKDSISMPVPVHGSTILVLRCG